MKSTIRKILREELNIDKLIFEQVEDSSISCDQNTSKSGGNLNNWKTMDPKKRSALLKSIENIIKQTLSKSKQEYLKWFKDPLTIKKFKTPKEQNVLKKLPAYLSTINKINITLKGPNNSSNARAWVTSRNPDTINYNLSQLHDTRNFVGQSIYYTTKHEMGHLIDYFFKKYGVNTYIQTINTDTVQSYNANYIVNDGDQYTRLNVLRGIIGAGPADSPKTLLDKFMAKVNNGTIKSTKFNFSGVVSTSKQISKKNNTQTANKIYRRLSKGISVRGKDNHNIEQLFSNFAIEKGGVIYVSFDLLAQLNFTSKAAAPSGAPQGKKYYFLAIKPK